MKDIDSTYSPPTAPSSPPVVAEEFPSLVTNPLLDDLGGSGKYENVSLLPNLEEVEMSAAAGQEQHDDAVAEVLGSDSPVENLNVHWYIDAESMTTEDMEDKYKDMEGALQCGYMPSESKKRLVAAYMDKLLTHTREMHLQILEDALLSKKGSRGEEKAKLEVPPVMPRNVQVFLVMLPRIVRAVLRCKIMDASIGEQMTEFLKEFLEIVSLLLSADIKICGDPSGKNLAADSPLASDWYTLQSTRVLEFVFTIENVFDHNQSFYICRSDADSHRGLGVGGSSSTPGPTHSSLTEALKAEEAHEEDKAPLPAAHPLGKIPFGLDYVSFSFKSNVNV